MNEQKQQLRRVTNAIATHVIKFIDEHEGKVFSNAELHSYVAERHRMTITAAGGSCLATSTKTQNSERQNKTASLGDSRLRGNVEGENMAKDKSEVRPNYGPVYAAALYPQLARICVDHGYALAVHGSVARDFDLVAVPWAKKVSTPEKVLTEITDKFDVRRIGKGTTKNHGRVAYTISIGFGECALDFSFMPRSEIREEKPNRKARKIIGDIEKALDNRPPITGGLRPINR